MPLNFTEALSNLKRKAQLEGRPLSPQVTAGVAKGEGEAATDRLIRMKKVQQEKENLEQRKQEHIDNLKQQEEDRKSAEKTTIASTTATGATLGYTVAGTAVGGIYGAIIGGALGWAAKECIIITACTSKDSYEVEISRVFRDKYMSPLELGGYYALAGRIAPMIRKSHFLKLITKKFLVGRLVDYAEWLFELKPKTRFRTSQMVTKGFLSLCAAIGMEINTSAYIEVHR